MCFSPATAQLSRWEHGEGGGLDLARALVFPGWCNGEEERRRDQTTWKGVGAMTDYRMPRD